MNVLPQLLLVFVTLIGFSVWRGYDNVSVIKVTHWEICKLTFAAHGQAKDTYKLSSVFGIHQSIITGTKIYIKNTFFFFSFFFFSVRLLSVLHGHSVFHTRHNGQWPPSSKDFYTKSYPLHYLILEKEPVFPFSMLSAKQGNYWYHFYNVFGMTRSLTGDWTPDLPHSTPALYH